MDTQKTIDSLAAKMREQLGFSQEDATQAAAIAVSVLAAPGFDNAVDWLLNSRHTADPDIQNQFWALSDGLITDDEVESLSAAEIHEIRQRHAAA